MRTVIFMVSSAVVVVAIGIALVWMLSRSDSAQAMAVIDRYAEYYELAQYERSLISVPGHGDTESRKALHGLLTEILTVDMSDAERLVQSEYALEELIKLRKDINEATKVREEIAKVIDAYEHEHEQLALLELQTLSSDLLAVMRERQVIVNEITATLYAVNGHTHEIIEEIQNAEGALTPEHIYEINQATSMAETRFDRLGESYHLFNENDEALERLAADFVARALQK